MVMHKFILLQLLLIEFCFLVNFPLLGVQLSFYKPVCYFETVSLIYKILHSCDFVFKNNALNFCFSGNG